MGAHSTPTESISAIAASVELPGRSIQNTGIAATLFTSAVRPNKGYCPQQQRNELAADRSKPLVEDQAGEGGVQ